MRARARACGRPGLASCVIAAYTTACVHAPAGTLIVFDVSAVHTGKVVLNGSRASLTNIYGLQSRDTLRDFPADTVKDHLHRVYHGFTAGDSPAVSAERAALAGGYTPRCDQMSA